MKLLSILIALALIGTSSAVLVIPRNATKNIETEDLDETSDWLIERISTFGGSSPPALAIDSMNRPNVLYCPPGEVWFSSRNESGWEREKISDTVGGGLCGSMDLGPDDIPHVFFAIPPPGAPPFPHYATMRNDSWLLEPVDVCRGGDITVDGHGEPHIACFNRSEGGTTWEIRHVTLLNDSWHVDYVDSLRRAPGSGWISISMDSSNNPHILYYADTIGEVRYAFKDNDTWKIEVVDTIGNIRYVGRHGSLALDGMGRPHAAYMANVSYPDNKASLRYALRTQSGWQVQTVRGPPGMKGRFASIGVDEGGAVHVSAIDWFILNPSNYSFLADLNYGKLTPPDWSWETVYAGFQFGNDPMNRHDDIVNTPDFSTMRIDACGNPHIVFALQNLTDPGIKYATKGECPPQPEEEPSISLDIDPNTLNLKSRGRWITAYLTAKNASIDDVNISSILLQDSLKPERWDYQENVLMLKFNRQEFKNTVVVGDSVEIKISGKWKDGNSFQAFDFIRVISPGKK